MKRLHICVGGLLVLLLPCVVLALDVEEIQVGKSVEDRVLLEPGTEFRVADGKLYCFTRIVDGSGTTIRHVWTVNGEEVSDVSLSVGSENWRTWSSKLLGPGMEGDWMVKVLDAEGDLLESVKFTLLP